MPRNRTSHQPAFNAGLFEPEALAAPGGLQTALGSVRKICYDEDSLIMEMVTELNRYPYVLEYILSGTHRTPALTVGLIKLTVPCSIRRLGLREVVQVNHCSVPDAVYTQYLRGFGDQTSPTIIFFSHLRRSGIESATL